MSNEEEVPVPDEPPLAAELSDPTGPPQRVKKGDPVLGCMAAVGVTLVAAGGLLYPAFLSTGHTMGATRSGKLQWEQRRLEIEQAYAADQAYRSLPPGEQPGPEAPAHDGDAR